MINSRRCLPAMSSEAPLLVLCLIGLCLPSSAQNTPALQLPVLVDGSKYPEQIPDQLAYRHFLLAVAEHRSPTAIEADRQRARLRPIGLSDVDSAAFRDLLANLREQLDAIEQARATLDSGAITVGAKVPTIAALKAQEDDLIATTITSLPARLGIDGLAKLDQHIRQQVKRKIVIYGTSGANPHAAHQN